MSVVSRIALVVTSALSLKGAVSLPCDGGDCAAAPALSMVQREASLVQTVQEGGLDRQLPALGHESCPCVGIGFSEGRVSVRGVQFAAGLGSSCQAWEKNDHPSCNVSSPPSWCSASWCYVDPCNCDHGYDAVTSYYFPNASYQGKRVRYSYATCGSLTSYVPQHVRPEPVDEEAPQCYQKRSETECGGLSWCVWRDEKCTGKKTVEECQQPVDQAYYGDDKCKCVGIDNMNGMMKGVVLKYWKEQFPADIGGSCQNWDSASNPGCISDGTKPHWCNLKFCYVDPCTCDMPMPAQKSSYFPNATFQGKPVYFSYDTCANDYEWDLDQSYPSAAKDCFSQASMSYCAAMPKCAWINDQCREKELEAHCL